MEYFERLILKNSIDIGIHEVGHQLNGQNSLQNIHFRLMHLLIDILVYSATQKIHQLMMKQYVFHLKSKRINRYLIIFNIQNS